MEHSFKITDINADAVAPGTKKHFIDVSVDIFDGDTFLKKGKFGYPQTATKEEILADLKKVCEALDSDKYQTQRAAKHNAMLAQAEETKKALLDT